MTGINFEKYKRARIHYNKVCSVILDIKVLTSASHHLHICDYNKTPSQVSACDRTHTQNSLISLVSPWCNVKVILTYVCFYSTFLFTATLLVTITSYSVTLSYYLLTWGGYFHLNVILSRQHSSSSVFLFRRLKSLILIVSSVFKESFLPYSCSDVIRPTWIPACYSHAL